MTNTILPSLDPVQINGMSLFPGFWPVLTTRGSRPSLDMEHDRMSYASGYEEADPKLRCTLCEIDNGA